MDEQMRELTNDAVIDLVKEAGLDWHAGFNLDDENRYGTLVRLAFNLGAALSHPAAQGDSSHPAGGECGGVQGLTPGPYSVRKSLAGTGFWHITSPAKQDIGAVRSLADAHMFAASLDLFDALKGVLRVADRATAEFDAARAAIAKATP